MSSEDATKLSDAEGSVLSFVDHLGSIRSEDQRNIQDRYRWWSHDDIVADLRTSRSEFLSVFLNVQGDFNVSSGIRNNLWFNSSGAYIVGKKRYDVRGTVGAQHYLPVQHNPSPAELVKLLREQGYHIVAAEITDDAVPLTSYSWNVKSAVLFGEENAGLAEEILSLCDDVVYIPGRGSVRSLNVATTSGIFLYDYSAKLGLLDS